MIIPGSNQTSHKSIIAYLGVANLPKTAQVIREELGIGDSFDDATKKKYEGLLEKKWTSVVRLQKKVGKHLPSGPRHHQRHTSVHRSRNTSTMRDSRLDS